MSLTKKLVIIGAGGHGRVIADAAETMGVWADVSFYDDSYDPQVPFTLTTGKWKVRGHTREISKLDPNLNHFVVAISDNHKRLTLVQELLSLGLSLPSVVHPRATVSLGTTLGPGCVVFAGTVINIGSILGRGCIINTGATVDHDCSLSDAVHVSPGAHLAGGVRIGECSSLGTGACVVPGIQIGKDIVLGAGAVVVKDILDAGTYVGVPAKRLLKK